jgi:hypothetical protein
VPSQAEITANQIVLPDDFLDVATIYTQSETDDGEHGSTTSETARATGVPCSYGTLSGRELVRAQQLAAEATSVVRFAPDVVLYLSDRIVVTIAMTGEQRDLQVSYVPAASYKLRTVAYCQELGAR